MKFYMPTKLFRENNCVKNHAKELASLGKRALIVTGKSSSAKNGSLSDVTEALDANSVEYLIFDKVEENPSVETVMAARDAGVGFGADLVIGVGGGSPLDASKAAALMIKHADKSWEYLYEEGTDSDALPLAAVPTTCGTGSEVTGVAVLTRHDLRTKRSSVHRVFPALALVDGKYIMGAPHKMIVNTAVDALGHLVESGINSLSDTCSDMLVYTGLSVWAACRPCIEGNEPIDAEYADLLMEASSLAGMAIAQTGTSIPHSLSYMLTYEAGIPHGAAVGTFLAKYVRYAPQDRQDLILSSAGFLSHEQLGEFISRITNVSVDRDLLERSAESVMNNPAKLKICPYDITDEIMNDLITI